MVYGMPEASSDLSETDLVDDLERAIQAGELRLYYQPQVSLADNRTVGVEALIRWEHPQRGLLLPGQFMPPAEVAGLGRRITKFVLPQAIADLVRWSYAGWGISVSVNLAPQDLTDSHIVDLVSQQVVRLPVPRHRLILEITEHSAISDIKHASDTLATWRRAGVRTSLDDFGTGYSSLSYLAVLALDEIKLDRAFLVANRDTDGYLLRSAVEIGHHLGLRVVGEGAETLADVETLRSAGVEVIQGFWFSRAVPRRQIASSYVGGCTEPGCTETIRPAVTARENDGLRSARPERHLSLQASPAPPRPPSSQ